MSTNNKLPTTILKDIPITCDLCDLSSRFNINTSTMLDEDQVKLIIRDYLLSLCIINLTVVTDVTYNEHTHTLEKTYTPICINGLVSTVGDPIVDDITTAVEETVIDD